MENRSAEREVFRVFRKAMRLGGFFGERARWETSEKSDKAVDKRAKNCYNEAIRSRKTDFGGDRMRDNAVFRVWRAYQDSIIPVLCLGVYVLLACLLHIPCPFRFAVGIPCPGCGMTRACIALIKGDVQGAFALHPLWPLIPLVPILLAVFHGEKRRLGRTLTIWGTVLLMIGVYVYRMFVLHDPVLACTPENSLAARVAEGILRAFGR